MATVTKGKTFGATEEVTNVKLHQLVDSATITSIDSADFDLAATQPIHVGTAAPSDTTQRGWYDTTNNVFRMKDSGNVYQPVSGAQFFTNKSGGALAAGDVVIIDTSNDSAVTTTTTANSTSVMGVVLIGGADEAEVAVITEGYCPAVTVTGSTDNGDYLFTSTTAKKADPNSSHGSGAFGRALTTDSSSVEAQIGGAAVSSAIGGARFNAVGVINSTRDVSAATGAVNYAHGLGQKPVELRVHYGFDGLNGASCSGTCISIDSVGS